MAKLPNADRAVMDERKITEYLLCEEHPVGGPKSVLFASFGFTAEEPDVLAAAILGHVRSYDATPVATIKQGTKYEISGPLPAPDGRMPTVKSLRIIRTGEVILRFVTAVPD